MTHSSNSNLKDASADQDLAVLSEPLAPLNNAIDAEASLHEFWNDYAEHYSLLRESRVYEQLMQQTFELARIESGIQCLDLACGPGNYVLEMAKKGSDVVGVDYSEKMIAIAQSKLSQPISLNKMISLVQMDVLDYIKTVPDNFFDVVISALFLSYVKQADEIVSEIYRILKPGGRFVMSNPRPDANFTQVWIDSIFDILRKPLTFVPVSVRIWIYAKRIESFSKKGVFHFFNRSETYQLLNSTGFKTKNVRLTETFSGQVYLVCSEKE